MNEGNIVIVPMHQSDGSTKNRPAIVLREVPPFRDVLVCGVSTQLQHEVIGFDELITIADSDFKTSGLRHVSLIRLGFLFSLSRSQIAGSIGSISAERLYRLRKNLSDFLIK